MKLEDETLELKMKRLKELVETVCPTPRPIPQDILREIDIQKYEKQRESNQEWERKKLAQEINRQRDEEDKKPTIVEKQKGGPIGFR